MKTALVLVPPNIPSMDSSAGGRFQATYNADGAEASHWIPLWICYAAGALPTVRAMDCNVEGISREEFLKTVPDYDIYVFYGNQETVAYDLETARQLSQVKPDSIIAFAGPFSSVVPERMLGTPGPGVTAAIRGEIEGPLRGLCENKPLAEIRGLTWMDGSEMVSNPDTEPFEDLDSLTWASKIIRRDLPLLKYRIPYLNYPYISIFSGRGCPYRCTYCLWPQTLSGHKYRKRSITDVAEEMIWIHSAMPEINEIQIEDDTFTCDRDRVLELCDALDGKGIMWSCCARHDLPLDILARMKKAGARNLVVGFESGNDEILKNIRKGVTTAQARQFMKDCREVGLLVHGCFVFGLPGETLDTMKETLEYSFELNPNTVQFTIASPYEGTKFNDYLKENGYLKESGITATGHLSAAYDYPELSGKQINQFCHDAWKSYYLRPSTILNHIRSALTNVEDAKRFLHGAKYVGDYLFLRQPHQKKT